MCRAGLAPRICSATAHTTVRGATWPPSSGLVSRRQNSACCSAWKERLIDSGRVTEWVSGSNTGGFRSPSANDSPTGPSAKRATSAMMPRAVSSSISVNGGVPRSASVPSTSNRLNSMSRTLLL